VLEGSTQFGSLFKERHPEAPRFHERGKGSGVQYFKLTYYLHEKRRL